MAKEAGSHMVNYAAQVPDPVVCTYFETQKDTAMEMKGLQQDHPPWGCLLPFSDKYTDALVNLKINQTSYQFSNFFNIYSHR